MPSRVSSPARAAVALAAAALIASCRDEAPVASARAKLRAPLRHTDHSTFFREPFADGPSVTRACLECHPQAAAEVMKTAHWNWEGEEVVVPGHAAPARIGKKNVINNFCVGVASNWAACTSCHVGYGWEDADFDFENAELVDCLVCHDQSGTYQKKAKGAGLPDPGVDLLAAARSVGAPKRQNCGTCHFAGGGGNAVKHGDLDKTLLFPSERIDVHMADQNLQCTDCHRTEHHDIRGRSMSVSVDDNNRVACTDCHPAAPHADARLNDHTERVACQTCHVPFMAVDQGTKMSWDWSQAGEDNGESDPHVYLKIKGRFTWAKGAVPEYAWYNLTSTHYLLGDTIDPAKPTPITAPLGDKDDPRAKIWPFKVHRGKQIYDAKNRYFLVPNTHGAEGYWTKFDWDRAAQIGAQATGLAYSGEYGFAPTEMYWPLSHMVTPKENALTCRDCHGERGRLDWRALGYEGDPLGKAPIAHEAVTLKDADGGEVEKSGKPLSTTATCGECHDLSDDALAASHHGRLDPEKLPPERRALLRYGPSMTGGGTEANCFLCHLADPDLDARARALATSEPAWSIAATLGKTGLVQKAGETYRYDKKRFGEDGSVDLGIQAAHERSCGLCHGLVDTGDKPLRMVPGRSGWATDKTGQVFSPQRLHQSALNLVDKDELRRSWDIHAERLVACGDCHYGNERPARLAGDVPAADRGRAGEKRRCQSCHSLEGLHAWLPARDVHVAKVACEACHVPQLRTAAEQLVDRTVARPDGGAKIVYRGIVSGEGATAYLGGYEPVLLRAVGGDGAKRLTPFNLVATYEWATNGKPVAPELVRRAFLDQNNGYHPEIVAAFDAGGDGELSDRELALDTAAKTALVKKRLEALGATGAEVRGELRAYAIHHGVTDGEGVSRDCSRCHPASNEAQRAFPIAPYLPAGVRPEPVAGAPTLDGVLAPTAEGGLLFTPVRPRANSSQREPLQE